MVPLRFVNFGKQNTEGFSHFVYLKKMESRVNHIIDEEWDGNRSDDSNYCQDSEFVIQVCLIVFRVGIFHYRKEGDIKVNQLVELDVCIESILSKELSQLFLDGSK